jgi:hypothetical protein
MNLRRLAPLAAVGLLALGAFAPAQAAPKKFAGSYTVTLLPDPSPNAFVLAGMANCQNVNPQSVDKRDLAVPRAGRLNVVLDSADPTGTGNTDWDLYVLDSAGDELGSSHGGSSHEETSFKLKTKQTISVIVCNLAGQPSGTVTYSLA